MMLLVLKAVLTPNARIHQQTLLMHQEEKAGGKENGSQRSANIPSNV